MSQEKPTGAVGLIGAYLDLMEAANEMVAGESSSTLLPAGRRIRKENLVKAALRFAAWADAVSGIRPGRLP